jgi:Secretion system C-terminal sorting domain
MKKVQILLIFVLCSLSIMAQNNHADIHNAKLVCNKNTIAIPSIVGNKGIDDDISDVQPLFKETHIVWFKFYMTNGTFGFKVTPYSPAADIDFIFLSQEETGSLVELATSISGPSIRGNYTTFCANPQTGITSTALDIMELGSSNCSPDIDGFTKMKNFYGEGKTYYLGINNYFNTTGFSIEWLGTCGINCTTGTTAQNKLAIHSSPNSNISVNQVFPNPVDQTLTWVLSANKSQLGEINILDISGKMIHQETRNIEKGLQHLSFDVSSLPSGAYTISLSCDKENHVQKFIKIN